MAQRVFAHSRSTRTPTLMHPQRDWMIGLLVGFFLLCVIAMWSTYTYIINRSGQSIEVSAESAVAMVYREPVVTAALEVMGQRAAKFSALTGKRIDQIVAPITDLEAATTTTEQTEDIIVSTDIETDSVIESDSATNDEVISEPDSIQDPTLEPEENVAEEDTAAVTETESLEAVDEEGEPELIF